MKGGSLRWHDWLLLAVLGAVLGGVIVGVMTHAWPTTSITLSQAGAGSSYTDTTFVVAQIHYAASALGIVVVALLLHIALLRRASPTIAACGAIAIVLLILGLAVSTYPQAILGHAAIPRRYIDYPDTFSRLLMVSRGGTALSVSALTSLAGLSLRALLIRRRNK